MCWFPRQLACGLAAGSGLLVTVALAGADTVLLAPSADTCLFELDPGFNFGGQRDVPAGTLGAQVGESRSRALYRFAIAETVAAGAAVVAARLRVEVVRSPEGKRNSTFALHRVLVDWGEGDKRGDNPGGAPAETGEANWLARAHPDRPWSVPGGAFGEDFATEPAAERGVVGDGEYVFEFNATGLADVREALRSPDKDYGWLLVSQAEGQPKTARRWATREHRTSPPVLEIEFLAAPLPALPALELSIAPPGHPLLQFRAEPAVLYRILKSNDLEGWAMMTEVGPLETAHPVSIPDFSGEVSAFYRLVVPDSSPLNRRVRDW